MLKICVYPDINKESRGVGNRHPQACYSCTTAIRNELKNCTPLVLHCVVCIVYKWMVATTEPHKVYSSYTYKIEVFLQLSLRVWMTV